MNKDELIEFLQRQIEYLQQRLDEALASVNSLTLSNEKLTATVDELRKQIASLEEVLKSKGVELGKEKAARQAVQRLQGSSSERQPKPTAEAQQPTTPPESKPAKKRTNNGARRKTHPECQIEEREVYPDDPDFDPEAARFIGECEVVRYVMEPMRFIKVIYKEKKYIQGDKIYKGNAPAAPLLNSQYTSSFIAGLTELRYLHGMPLETAVEYFRSHGFDLDRGTAQKLVGKVKVQLENLYKAMAKAIVEDDYICGDETYQKVRLRWPCPRARKSRRVTSGSSSACQRVWFTSSMTTVHARRKSSKEK